MTDAKNVIISVSLGKAVSGGIAFALTMLGGLVWLSSEMIGDTRENISFIRDEIVRGQSKDSEIVNNAHTIETSLRGELTALTAELRKTVDALKSLGASVAGLNKSITNVDDRLAGSISR